MRIAGRGMISMGLRRSSHRDLRPVHKLPFNLGELRKELVSSSDNRVDCTQIDVVQLGAEDEHNTDTQR